MISESLAKKYGGGYTLTKDQAEARWKAYDLNNDGGVTEAEFWACLNLRK